MLAVKTTKLVKDYNGLKAVNELDLAVPEGAIYGFLGPNGAGKTTTLKMLVGMTKPTSGTIEILGRPLDFGNQSSMKDIGFLPDVPGFYDWMTATEFLMFCGNLFKIEAGKLSVKTEELLELVGLRKSGNKKIQTYSRGMKQRLGIAQALINDPKVILLDEPVSALDPQGRKEVIDIIGRLRSRVTVFFSTHILADVERICDRVVIIKEGRTLLEDTIENIKALTPSRQIEVELPGQDEKTDLDDLKDHASVDTIEHVGSTYLFTCHDLESARREIIRMIHEKDLCVKRMVIKEPTLEDIYLKVVD